MTDVCCSADPTGIPISSSPPTMAAPAPPVQPSSSESDVSRQAPSDSLAAAPPALSDNRNIVRRKLTGYVGFANLPNQWHRKSVRKGFNFNVMVVGEYFAFRNHGGTAFNLSFVQVNPASESQLSSTPCSTPPCIPPGSARARASTSSPRPSASSRSAPTSRRRACVCA